ncbi:MAG TPA: ABC transporter permease subunit [Chitinophagaceae bacterium]|nr:ABC transporter permease subunit [Chitinophagaceae bacterium]
MLHLLKIEWLKIKNYRTFWILAILYLLSIWGINFIVFSVQEKIFEKSNVAGNDGSAMVKFLVGDKPYAFPKVWQATADVSSFLLFIAGLIMIIAVSNEYSFKTHRQNIIDGLSRSQFILVKLVDGVIIALISSVLVVITGLFFGIYEGHTTVSFENFQYIFYFFLQALSYCWLAILFAILFKRSGIAIGVFFLYTVILENVLALVLNRAFPSSFFLTGTGNYLPIQSSDELMPFPAFEGLQKQILQPVNNNVQLILVIIYLTLYFIVSKRKFERDDL